MASELRVNTLKDASGNNSVALSTVAEGSAKAWAHIAAGGASLPDSFNFSSIDDDGTGEYGLNYTSAMNSTNYSATAVISYNHTSGVNNLRNLVIEGKTTSSVEVDGGYANTDAYFVSYDIELNASVAIHGDLA
jgi:hypothetical protein|tara:strand:+ start:345 stop:746 length:402 start_codon:yes stop_codon:yes gene_type:complete